MSIVGANLPCSSDTEMLPRVARPPRRRLAAALSIALVTHLAIDRAEGATVSNGVPHLPQAPQS
jgi:hypothetical protein